MNKHVAVARTYLFVPGNRPERFKKACDSGADAVIFDLEDAVGPDEKRYARQCVMAWFNAGNRGYVRVNAADTIWFSDDVACMSALTSLQGIVLPKAESAAQIASVQQHFQDVMTILPIVETAHGFVALAELCQAPGVERLIFGSLDLQADLRITDDGAALHYFRSQLVLFSRAYGLRAPVDGVTTRIHDDNAVTSETQLGKHFGFRGKLAIHPAQIAPIHAALAYSEEECIWALRVLALIAQSDGAAVALDGKMIDVPVVLKAQEILADRPVL